MYDQYDRSDRANLQPLVSLMVDESASQPEKHKVFPLSSFPVLTIESSTQSDGNDESIELGQELDPLGKRILSAAEDLLVDKDYITIKDLIEATGLGDAVLRKRMSHIVDLHHLGCIPGSGRSPSQYHALAKSGNPETPKTINAGFSDEQILEKIKQKEASLLEELDSLQQDKAALEKAIAVRRKYLA